MNRIHLTCGLLTWGLLGAGTAAAQQATLSTPMHRVSDGFHENIGVGFGFRLPNQPGFFFQGGSPASGTGNGNEGFSLRGPLGGGGYFNLFGDQGSYRGATSVVPSLTVINGGQGTIQDVTLRPFVVGVVPVVGGFAPSVGANSYYGTASPQATFLGPTILEERLARLRQEGSPAPKTNAVVLDRPKISAEAAKPAEVEGDLHVARHAAATTSSAGRPAASIAEIRQQQLHEDKAGASQAHQLLQRGRQLQNEGKIGLARLYFQQALSKDHAAVGESAKAALAELDKNLPSQK